MAICTSAPAQWAAVEALKLKGEARERRSRLAAVNIAQAAADARLTSDPSDTAVHLSVPVADVASMLERLGGKGFAAADGAGFGAPDRVRLTGQPGVDLAEAIRILAGSRR